MDGTEDQQHHLLFGSATIAYRLRYSDRRTLGIAVTPEMAVIVTAPRGAAMDKIEEKLRKRAPWILQQQRFFLGFHPRTAPKQFVSGESHLYLGRQLRLQVTEGKRNAVEYAGGHLQVTCKSKSKAAQLVQDWYRLRAKLKFAEIAEPWIQRFAAYGVAPTGLYLQNMPLRWGSCTPKGKIILNPELIKAPKPCIEYVIVHELCHLVHHDHTAAFVALQTREMPDWEKWKAKLERMLA